MESLACFTFKTTQIMPKILHKKQQLDLKNAIPMGLFFETPKALVVQLKAYPDNLHLMICLLD